MNAIDILLLSAVFGLTVVNTMRIKYMREDIDFLYEQVNENHVFMDDAALRFASMQGLNVSAAPRPGV